MAPARCQLIHRFHARPQVVERDGVKKGVGFHAGVENGYNGRDADLCRARPARGYHPVGLIGCDTAN